MEPKVTFTVELVAMSEHKPGWKKGSKLHQSEDSIRHLTLRFPSGKAFTFVASGQAIEEVTKLALVAYEKDQKRAKPKGK